MKGEAIAMDCKFAGDIIADTPWEAALWKNCMSMYETPRRRASKSERAISHIAVSADGNGGARISVGLGTRDKNDHTAYRLECDISMEFNAADLEEFIDRLQRARENS